MNVAISGIPDTPISTRSARGPHGGDRLDGWKLIAAHFGRDRTTVIRWARDRGLPVHRIPGGRSGTVYALRHELDAWAGLCESTIDHDAAPPAAPIPDVPPSLAPVHRRSVGRPWLLFGALALVAAASGPHAAPRRSVTDGLPLTPAIASAFLDARDLVAGREAEGLERAIAILERVTRQAPGFAPGHASLGEALLLSREFGKRDDADAFRRARHAARAAIRLDPALATGHRLLGFIAYWAENDFAEAQVRFEEALELDPDDALSHFWLGNILSDHGDHAAALTALNTARLMLPGSVAIRTDLAWARWAAGEEAPAIAALKEIARRNPSFPVAHDCLATIALLSGDDAGYVRHFAEFARARRVPLLVARAGELGSALEIGTEALHSVALSQALAELAAGTRTRVWAVAAASIARDRATVLRLLHEAEIDRERWVSVGALSRIRTIWRADPELIRLIEARAPRA
ncbi:tetratricopeptide repeat protein [Sphingomonas radiodurans]|uniref:tetratricopeptide repeat protein n=1 Tax=Sphingomonas radiodurans TaxID=2890321 RepID=UPI001E5D8A09|nr:tetratricopeptide repeat protein [Sphingomonas radiodurans]WBH14988.1 tetratricopeptide repeat protein [Sphingomonas radiodurans]